MSKFIPIQKSMHSALGWTQSQNYQFASCLDMVPLLSDEVSHAMASMPLAFRRQKNQVGKLTSEFVALLSPFAGQNLFVKTDGHWLSGYVPAYLRTYPFRMIPASDTGQPLVCFDQESGMLVDAASAESTPFFAEAGEPSPALARVMQFLQEYELRRVQTQKAVDTLSELGLLVPWRLALKAEDDQVNTVKGLYKVDPGALQRVSAESLLDLHKSGALLIAHAQLLSEQRVQSFGELLRTQVKLKKKTSQDVTLGNIEALFGNQSDVLNLDNF